MKRFGRNQRRALRERIAELEGHYYRGASKAEGRFPRLETFGVIDFSVEVNETRRCVERRASVVLGDLRNWDGIGRSLVSFQDVTYQVSSARMRDPEFIGGPFLIELSLVGVLA